MATLFIHPYPKEKKNHENEDYGIESGNHENGSGDHENDVELEKEKPAKGQDYTSFIQGGKISHPGRMLGKCPQGTTPGPCPPGLNNPGSICCRRQRQGCPRGKIPGPCTPGLNNPSSICCRKRRS